MTTNSLSSDWVGSSAVPGLNVSSRVGSSESTCSRCFMTSGRVLGFVCHENFPLAGTVMVVSSLSVNAEPS